MSIEIHYTLYYYIRIKLEKYTYIHKKLQYL